MHDASADVSTRASLPLDLVAGLSDQTPPAIEPIEDATRIAKLQALVEAQAVVIREQALSLAHSRKIFELAAAAARIGVWECRLEDESLTWTDGVYRIFDLPAGSPVDRRTTLQCYSPESRLQLDEIRSRAIAERGGFSLDAEIVTIKGNRRWVRLTATVECDNDVPVRIFGMKQDITEEKLLSDRTRYLAEFDTLTALPNRSVFQSRLFGMGRAGALLLIDLDGFKQVNDTYGHSAGDACLAEVGRRLTETCRRTEFVARIGGDEFGVIVGEAIGAKGLTSLATRIVDAMGQPVIWDGRTLQIGASVGIATMAFSTPEDIFAQADAALYAAKAAGRGTFRRAEPAA